MGEPSDVSPTGRGSVLPNVTFVLVFRLIPVPSPHPLGILLHGLQYGGFFRYFSKERLKTDVFEFTCRKGGVILNKRWFLLKRPEECIERGLRDMPRVTWECSSRGQAHGSAFPASQALNRP